jgi:hypothetical protein
MGAAPAIGRDEQLRTRLAQDEANFLRAADRHDRQHHRAGMGDADTGDHPFAPRRERDGDDVSRADTTRAQPGGEAYAVSDDIGKPVRTGAPFGR